MPTARETRPEPFSPRVNRMPQHCPRILLCQFKSNLAGIAEQRVLLPDASVNGPDAASTEPILTHRVTYPNAYPIAAEYAETSDLSRRIHTENTGLGR